MFVSDFVTILNALPSPTTTYIKVGTVYGGTPTIMLHENIAVVGSSDADPSVT